MDFSQIASQLFSLDVSDRLAALATLAERGDDGPLPPDVLHGLLHCLGHNRKAVQRVYHAPGQASFIELPLVNAP